MFDINGSNCIICNSELDEKYAGGIWDLSGEICEALMLDNAHNEQEVIYNIVREYIEKQNFCCNCGKINNKSEVLFKNLK